MADDRPALYSEDDISLQMVDEGVAVLEILLLDQQEMAKSNKFANLVSKVYATMRSVELVETQRAA